MRRGAIVNLIIGATIALLPLFNRVATVDFSRTAKDNLLMAILGLLCVIMPEKKRSLPLYAWVVFIIALFFLVFNQYNVISINVMYQSFTVMAGMFFAVRFYECYDGKTKHYILNGMCIGALIQSFIIFLSALGFDPYIWVFGSLYEGAVIVGPSSFPVGKSIGSLGNTNLAAAYLALTSMAFVRGKWNYFLPIAILALTFTNSAMGVGSFVAGAVYYLNRERVFSKLKIYLLASISMIGLFFIGAGGADSGRFESWAKIFKAVTLKHFLIGMGPGWFPDMRLMYNGTHMVQEHNEYLALFNIFGIMGVILVIPFFLSYLKLKDTCRIFPAVLFIAFCNSYGHFSLHQSTTAIIIIVTIVICAVEGKRE